MYKITLDDVINMFSATTVEYTVYLLVSDNLKQYKYGDEVAICAAFAAGASYLYYLYKSDMLDLDQDDRTVRYTMNNVIR